MQFRYYFIHWHLSMLSLQHFFFTIHFLPHFFYHHFDFLILRFHSSLLISTLILSVFIVVVKYVCKCECEFVSIQFFVSFHFSFSIFAFFDFPYVQFLLPCVRLSPKSLAFFLSRSMNFQHQQ